MLPVYSDFTLRTASVMKYNIRSGEQSNLPSLPEPLAHFACTIFNNTIIVSGGFAGSYSIDQATNKVWEFDLQDEEWKPLPSLQLERYISYSSYIHLHIHRFVFRYIQIYYSILYI